MNAPGPAGAAGGAPASPASQHAGEEAASRPVEAARPASFRLAWLGEPADRAMARRIAESVPKGGSIAVLGHEHPDGDCIGSMIALCAALRARGHRATAFSAAPLPSRYRPLDRDAFVAQYRPEELRAANLVFVLDTATPERLGHALQQGVSGLGAPIVNIDHHITNSQFGTINWVEGQAAATGELVWRLLSALRWPLPAVALEPLYTALVTDTGQFAFSNTTPRVMRMAACLLEAGVDPEAVWRQVYLDKTPGELELETRARDSLEVWANGKIAVICLTAQDFADTKTTPEAAQEFSNIPRALAGSAIALFFYEVEDGKATKVSIRCKRELNASALAQGFGGGGHRQAAGCRLPVPLEEAKRIFRPAAEAAVG